MIGCQIVSIVMLGLLNRLSHASIWADSLRRLTRQCDSLSRICFFSQMGIWLPFTAQMCSATPDVLVSPRMTAFFVFIQPDFQGPAGFSFVHTSTGTRNAINTVFGETCV